jgi:hypothetical protein
MVHGEEFRKSRSGPDMLIAQLRRAKVGAAPTQGIRWLAKAATEATRIFSAVARRSHKKAG